VRRVGTTILRGHWQAMDAKLGGSRPAVSKRTQIRIL